MARNTFTDRAVTAIASIPQGRVATYGQLATLAGNPRAARQVARLLHACSHLEDLPWHRVVNREGRIVLSSAESRTHQRELLEREGIEFDGADAIDLERFLWRPDISG
jgi:methylated-DNA-protein-cysteine methyltransferase-like protein